MESRNYTGKKRGRKRNEDKFQTENEKIKGSFRYGDRIKSIQGVK